MWALASGLHKNLMFSKMLPGQIISQYKVSAFEFLGGSLQHPHMQDAVIVQQILTHFDSIPQT